MRRGGRRERKKLRRWEGGKKEDGKVRRCEKAGLRDAGCGVRVAGDLERGGVWKELQR